MAHQKETAIDGFELADDKGDKLFRDDRTVLGCYELKRIFFEIAEAAEQNITRGHVMFMEGADGLKVCAILGEELPFFGEPAKEITGEQGPGGRVEGAESTWEMQIRREDEFEFSASEINAPAHFFNTFKGHTQTKMFEQGDSPPVAENHGIATIGDLVDEWQAAGDIGVLVVADEIADLREGEYLFDLSQGMPEGQHRSGVNEYRLITVFNEIDMTLERIVRQDMPDPPDSFGNLHGFFVVVGGL